MLTWAFQFENRPYFEGLRTLSTNEIDKPVLNVFRLLAELGRMRLHLASDASRDPLAGKGGDAVTTPPDVSGMAAINGSGEVQVFLCSHHDDWDVHTRTKVEVEVTGLEPERSYRLQRAVIDGVHSNAHTAWVTMGEPQNPSPEQLCALKRAAMPQTVEETTLPATNGRCTFVVPMAAHSVCLAKLRPI
jgi:xylan 1,4-beta-xylosidase